MGASITALRGMAAALEAAYGAACDQVEEMQVGAGGSLDQIAAFAAGAARA